MAWYEPHQGLITDYMMIEQNISITAELLSWRDCDKQSKQIRLQAYRNDYNDGDYDYFFSLRSAEYPLSNLVFNKDVTELVCGNPKASAATIRKKLFKIMNAWWLNSPDYHSPKSDKEQQNDRNEPI
ncbi:hypothetical protein C7818_11928 [Leuconostoc mesenteroides]|uniref:hypothetical protein n=1 Tax=Leuconostoc mesenteroides TaxID=1245 RepID=UPI001064BE34|nr:hypothetical protein [Leuconostoc mesenteroides]TDV88228.1 hypothetical protein C7818_11928 [Leuconostoc mesenteroides]